MASIEEVKAVIERADFEIKRLEALIPEYCRCEEFSSDMKGPCGYCTSLGQWREIKARGEKILTMETYEFHAEAPVFLQPFQRRMGI